ncbi:hypothetical protein L3Y34_019692 [Caenorhabditis briggsae]|uniref:Uncharacterized protein n=1 Tax=Caenorhabditis briggsae TaxID=6238 RepID=A0AAE9IWG5_CAEBR|nr:hypothetical protein L3Y34_019692 [Caenorhabditis briggsae]
MDPPDYYTKPTKFKNGKMTDLGIGRVLEYMSFERRSQIAIECPTIRGIEKSTPMNLEKLCFDYDGFTVNSTNYSILPELWKNKDWNNRQMIQEILPKDFPLGLSQLPEYLYRKQDFGSSEPPFPQEFILKIKRDKDEQCYLLKKDYSNLSLYLATKNFATEFFGKNRKIYTGLLELNSRLYGPDATIYRLLEGLEIYPTKVKTRGEPMDQLGQILAPNHEIQVFSLPLQGVRPHIFGHPFVINSKKLQLHGSTFSDLESYLQFINRLPNRNIVIGFEILRRDFPGYIRRGITVPLAVGTEFSWILWDAKLSETLNSLKKELQGFAIRGEEGDERFQDTVYCIAIPRTDGETELQLLQKIRIRPKYANNPDIRFHDNEIRLRVVPRGTSIPADADSVECALRRKKHLKMLKSPFYLIGGIIIVFLVALALLIIIPILLIVYLLYKITEWAKIIWCKLK